MVAETPRLLSLSLSKSGALTHMFTF